MKITQVISDTNVGGAGVLISSVIGSLKNDFDFEVIIPKGSALKERLPSDVNVTELKIKGDRSFYPTDVSDFYKFFKKQMPDVIHTHAQLSSRIGGKMAGVKACISTRHCAHGENNTSKRPLLQRCFRILSKGYPKYPPWTKPRTSCRRVRRARTRGLVFD